MSFFESCEPYVAGLQLPAGVLVPGLDLAPVLGPERSESAALASAFRAVLLLANERP